MKPMKLFKIILLLQLVIVAALVITPVAEAQNCMDNENFYELDFWVGDWEVFGTRTGELAGTNVIEKILDGCALFEQWIGEDGYSGTSITYLDPVSENWTQVWVDNLGGSQNYRDGIPENGAVRFDYEMEDDDENENGVIGRMILIRLSDTGVRQLNQTSIDEGQTWRTLYDLTYIRRN
jgi:hypothetical protein